MSKLLLAGTAIPDIARQLGVHQSTVYRLRNRMRSGIGYKPLPRPGRKRSVRTKEAVAKVKRRIKAGPTKSISAIAASVGISRPTASRIVKDLGGLVPST